ncbi:MAG: THUMP domain-containing protein [Desulfurococcales archaeon]|nr:THUMP domain-containing protein [Desulfurococcales archaeon]
MSSRRNIELYAPFNLIVSHLPGYDEKREAMKHLRWLLDDVEIVESRPNLLLAKVEDPIDAVERLKRSLPKHTTILRVIPVMEVTYPNVENVRDVIHKLLKGREGSFAIKLDGHLYDSEGRMMHKVDSITVIADGIDLPVNLSNPDILVYIKIVKYRRNYLAALYVGSPEGILSVKKLFGENKD